MLISKRLLVPAALAAAILFALLWLNAPAIRSAGNEIGDLAANSLLVIDAKNFRLLTGNYSRLGFNHPGPAFLYVLAGGEALFHDVLSLTAGPIGGQLIAVCFLTAVWVGLLTYQLCRLMEGTLEGLNASAAFLAVLVSLEPQSLAGMWFPHLYVLAFGVFLFSLARLATGSLDGLWITTLAGSMLIHGHASFLAIVPLMAGSALALGVASRRRCIEPGTVSVVYGVNTLHVARDLAFTLEGVRRALALGGLVLAAECMRPFAGRTVYVELVFVLLEAFRRPGGGFRTPEEWRSAFEAAGFANPFVWPDLPSIRPHYPSFVVAATGATRR